ncbi:MAG: hypothetical protein ACE5HI_05825, partial [bacterium]
MKNLQRTFSLILLLPILLINFPVGAANSCQTNAGMQKMACCDSGVSQHEKFELKISGQPCECQLSQSPNTTLPVVT